jgi:hypothetical protein
MHLIKITRDAKKKNMTHEKERNPIIKPTQNGYKS